MREIHGYEALNEEVEEMRLWLLEFFHKDDRGLIEELNGKEVMAAISKYYDDGLKGWYAATTLNLDGITAFRLG